MRMAQKRVCLKSGTEEKKAKHDSVSETSCVNIPMRTLFSKRY